MSDDQFIEVKKQKQTHDYENNLAWGNKRGNFYQKQEDQYSQIQEQEEQVQNIMERIAEQVDDQDFALQTKGSGKKRLIVEEDEDLNDYSENIKMLKGQIKSILLRLKEFEAEEDEQFYDKFEVGKFSFKQEYVNSHQAYVMTMLMLIKMYQDNQVILQKHSIITRLGELKILCDRFYEQQQILEQSKQQYVVQQRKSSKSPKPLRTSKQARKDSDEQHLQKYNTLVNRHKRIKKQQKKERRLEKISVIPQKAFAQVAQNEARNINYTISKNKGLTRRRGKKPRSSRASNREKFEQKMIKYRSANPMYKDHGLYYQGEQEIKIGKVQSSKLV